MASEEAWASDDGAAGGAAGEERDPAFDEVELERDASGGGRWAGLPTFDLDDRVVGLPRYRRSGLVVVVVGHKASGKTRALLAALASYERAGYVYQAQAVSPTDVATGAFGWPLGRIHPLFVHDLREAPRERAERLAAEREGRRWRRRTPAERWLDRLHTERDGAMVDGGWLGRRARTALVVLDDTGASDQLLRRRSEQMGFLMANCRHMRLHLWMALQDVLQLGAYARRQVDWFVLTRETNADSLDAVWRAVFRGRLSARGFLSMVDEVCVRGVRGLLVDMRNDIVVYQLPLDPPVGRARRPLGSRAWREHADRLYDRRAEGRRGRALMELGADEVRRRRRQTGWAPPPRQSRH